MSDHPISVQEAQHNAVSFSTTREREFYKYLPPISHPLHHVDKDTITAELTGHIPADPALSSFAQLGSLRLNARRVLISLFGRHEQHILAEATRTQSLRDENEHKEGDELWVGVCTMSYERSFSAALAVNPTAASAAQASKSPIFTVEDLTQDDFFRHHPDVTGYPNARFLAAAPIVSPKGIVIGAYTVLDDKPRGPLEPDLVRFLTEMPATVMDYLAMSRFRAQHLRGERMMVGLGSFLEGRGSLRSSWLEETDGGATLATTSPTQDNDVEGLPNPRQQVEQRVEESTGAIPHNRGEAGLPFRPKQPQSTPDRPKSSASPKSNSPPPGSDRSKIDKKNDATAQAERDQNNRPTKKETYMSQVEDTFGKAANIVRESLEVEGVVFFDANFVDQDAVVISTSKSDQESSMGSQSSESEEGEITVGKRYSLPKPSQLVTENSGKDTVNPAKMLGFATSKAASVNNEPLGDSRIALSESFLSGLMRRYPAGKIFNFGEDGSFSSGDTSDTRSKITSGLGSRRYKGTRKSVLRHDALALLNLAPEARSIVFSPIWDSHKSRWYAGTIAWTKAASRIFTIDDELTYCTAFGSCLIAEVHRLGSLLADRAKSDLLASLSHELRSPLHGIFGTAELLNDTAMDALQRGFVHTIASCASTLLGSINQLLEFSSINDMRKSPKIKPSSSPRSTLKRETSVRQAGEGEEKTSVQLDLAIEDTIETVFAGFSFFHKSRFPAQAVTRSDSDQFKRAVTLPGGVKLILDIDYASNWVFATSPGAWHVILTNLVGNALKYTRQGYILVTVKVKPVLSKKEEESSGRSVVTVSVQDTGCGMDPEFLRNGYFTAFAQEDDILPGNGLGANITQRTVTSLGGEIHVRSQKNVGTQVDVSLTLDHVSDGASAERNSGDKSENDLLPSTRRLVHKKSIGILGLGTSELDSAMSSSLFKIFDEWLEMEVHLVTPDETTIPQCDFYIAPHEYLDKGNYEIQSIAPNPGQLPPPVIVICSSPRVAHKLFLAARQSRRPDVLDFVTQPCGPRKLAKSLDICFKRQQRHIQGILTPEASAIPSPLDRLKAPIPPTPISEFGRPAKLTPTSAAAPTSAPRQQPSESLRGAKDYFSIPSSAQPAAPKSAQTPIENISPHSTTKQDQGSVTALLVDDNDINLSLLVAFMKKLGLEFITARDGQEAVDAFKENPSRVRLVLMDISMPVMDGLEASRQIRAFENTLEQHERAVIVALTGVAKSDTQREALASGMDLFLTKPVRLNTIKEVIKERMGLDLPAAKSGK